MYFYSSNLIREWNFTCSENLQRKLVINNFTFFTFLILIYFPFLIEINASEKDQMLLCIFLKFWPSGEISPWPTFIRACGLFYHRATKTARERLITELTGPWGRKPTARLSKRPTASSLLGHIWPIIAICVPSTQSRRLPAGTIRGSSALFARTKTTDPHPFANPSLLSPSPLMQQPHAAAVAGLARCRWLTGDG